jgi:hypothetical protein
MTGILRRFPPFPTIVSVYSVVAVPIFGWTITSWLWKLPSWLNFLTAGEITAIFFYAMLTAFVESLLVCGLLLFPCLVLPAPVFRDQFVVRGTWLALGVTASILGHGIWRGATRFTYGEISLALWTLATLILIVLLAFLSTKIRFMTLAAVWIADRLLVFLFILVPLSILSLLVVVVRNTIPG